MSVLCPAEVIRIISFAIGCGKEGKIFDSNNINDGSDVLYARAKGKGKKPKTWTEFQKDQWDKVGGAENYTGEDAALFGAGVWLVGTMRWALSKVFG